MHLKEDLIELENKNIISNVISNNELYLFEDEIQKFYKKNISKYILLFRASRDGYDSLSFHNKCDGKKNTIILVKTMDGIRFGGFTDLVWNKNHTYNMVKIPQIMELFHHLMITSL